MHLRVLALTCILIGTFSFTAKAQLENFIFTMGNFDVEVRGEIIGLEPNGASTPSEVIVTNEISGEGLGGIVKALASPSVVTPFPVVFTSSDFNSTNDQFTVSNGAIIDSDFSAINSANFQVYFNVTLSGSPASSSYAFAGPSVRAFESPQITYALLVPEPASLPLMVVALGLLTISAFRKKLC